MQLELDKTNRAWMRGAHSLDNYGVDEQGLDERRTQMQWNLGQLEHGLAARRTWHGSEANTNAVWVGKHGLDEHGM